MKKLQKLVLHKAKIMNAPEMKHITGGYDTDDAPCYGAPTYYCTVHTPDHNGGPGIVQSGTFCDNYGLGWEGTVLSVFPDATKIEC